MIISFFFMASEIKADEILWPYFQYQPLFNIEESGEVTGYGIHVQNIIAKQMPEYTHKMVLAQPARLFEELRSGEKYAAYGPVKTPEREEFLYYSLPCRLVFTDTVVMHREKAKQYGEGALISLEKLARDQDLVMGHSKGASYGKRIDGVLNAHKATLKQETITGENAEVRQLKMIREGRIDWMIWDPLTLKILLSELGMQDKYGIYEIKEKEQAFVFAHIAVPKNEWGKQVIRKVNQILKKVIPTDAFYSGLSEWVPDELKPAFRKGYEKYIVQPANEYDLEKNIN